MFVRSSSETLKIPGRISKTPSPIPPAIKIEIIEPVKELYIPATDEDLILLNHVWMNFLREKKMVIAQTTYMNLFVAQPQLKRLFRLSIVPDDQLFTHGLFISHLNRFARFLDCTFLFMDKGKDQDKMKGLLSYMNGIGRAHAHIGKNNEENCEGDQRITQSDTETVFDQVYWKMFADALLYVIKEILDGAEPDALQSLLNGVEIQLVIAKLSEILSFLVEEMRKGLQQEDLIMKQA